MKTCFECHQTKPIDDFYPHVRMKDGHMGKCKDCHKLGMKTKRMDDPNVQAQERINSRKESHREYNRRNKAASQGRYKVAEAAGRKARRAVKQGLLIKPSACEQCGAEAPLEGSHHDYSRPLEVRWLCRRCHRRDDAAQPKTIGGNRSNQ